MCCSWLQVTSTTQLVFFLNQLRQHLVSRNLSSYIYFGRMSKNYDFPNTVFFSNFFFYVSRICVDPKLTACRPDSRLQGTNKLIVATLHNKVRYHVVHCRYRSECSNTDEYFKNDPPFPLYARIWSGQYMM
jgi:hypothetical protein